MTAEPRSIHAVVERMREVIASGRAKNPGNWSELAGLDRQYLYTLFRRVDQGLTPRIGDAALKALATAANVAHAWLATGEGAMEPPVGPSEVAIVLQDPPPAGRRGAWLQLTESQIVALPRKHIPIEELIRLGDAYDIVNRMFQRTLEPPDPDAPTMKVTKIDAG